jgi:hypothetical protein
MLTAVSEQVRVTVDGTITVVKLQALAVSVEVRGQGGRVADEALDQAGGRVSWAAGAGAPCLRRCGAPGRR